LQRRVVTVARAALARQRFVTPVEVVAGIGWLPHTRLDAWRRGQVEFLESAAVVTPQRLADALEILQDWARSTDLVPTETAYQARGRPLRFTATGDADGERAWRTHWASRDATQPAGDLLVFAPLKAFTCAECGGTGEFNVLEDGRALCLTCADLDHLVFLPAGDAALTRRARKASTLSAVVVRFSRTRKRYERQGVLVEQPALELAEEQCLGDEDARLRRRERDRVRRAEQDVALVARMAEEIVRLFPGCPAPRAEAIAAHTGLRGSGRVGRTAAGRALAEEAIVRAVVAAVRHEDTEYDRLLMTGVDRPAAREQVRPDIDRILDAWHQPR